jgi:hypothetical protein
MNSSSRFRIANYLQPNPQNSKRVTRPSRWGNPYRVGKEAINATEAVALFRDHLQRNPSLVELAKRELAGFDLGCTCPLDQPCHADVWLEVVNPLPTMQPVKTSKSIGVTSFKPNVLS